MEKIVNFLKKENWRQLHPPAEPADLVQLEETYGNLPKGFRDFLITVHGRFMPFGYGIDVGGIHGFLELEFASVSREGDGTNIFLLSEALPSSSELPFAMDGGGGVFVLDPARNWRVSLFYGGEREDLAMDFYDFISRFHLDAEF